MNIQQRAQELQSEIVAARRHLHAHPELGGEEHETTAFLAEELRKAGVDEVVTFEDITGCIGIIRGAKPGKTVMLRADIDALPIQEAPGKAYCSQNPGVMHACGHDCHAAMLLGAAHILAEQKDQLCGTVKLLFQMGEEIGRLSERYVEKGCLEGVDAIFGQHVWALLDAGTCNFAPGPRMACSDRFTLHIQGQTAHASSPHEGKDAIVAAAAVVMALQSLVSRVNDPRKPLVVTVGQMNGGQRVNILAGEAQLVGTVRAFDRDFRNSMPQRIEEVARRTAEAYGCTARCDYYFGPSPLINDQDDLTRLAQSAARKTLGEDCLRYLAPMTGAEDFSVFTEKVPGVYGFLGARNKAKGIECTHHHPSFDVDEDVLCRGAAIYAQFAVDLLSENS